MSARQHHCMMKSDQKTAFDTITAAINDDSPLQYIVFLDCPATSQTFLFNTILASFRGNNHITLAGASSGISAELLDAECTAHSRFKIPISICDNSTSNI